IAANAERFGVSNLVPVLGKAPEAWQGLPAPDALFVAGTGRQVTGIGELACDVLKPGGRIVVNIGGIETLAEVRQVLTRKAGEATVRMINISRGNDQLERLRFESLSPTFLLSAVKKGER